MSTVENVDESVETVEGPSVINDELVRSLALKLDLFVKVGREVPLTNLKRSGYLADAVESLGLVGSGEDDPRSRLFPWPASGALEDIVAGA